MKFWYFGFGMGFDIKVDAEDLFLGRDEKLVPEAVQRVENPR